MASGATPREVQAALEASRALREAREPEGVPRDRCSRCWRTPDHDGAVAGAVRR